MDTLIRTPHRKPYPEISPLQPALSQQGRTILVTGGSSGIGYAIARAFAQARAKKVIILGRRERAVETAVASLRAEFSFEGEIVGRVCDIADLQSIDRLWDEFAAEGIVIDVAVLNAASFSQNKPVLELGVETLLDDYRVNVLAPYRFAQRLDGQSTQSKNYLVNVSTVAIHNPDMAPTNLNYGASKNAAALLLQLITREIPPDKLQILSFHPGAILTQSARDHGYDENTLPWDDENLPGQFAVWAASDEARFLNGRFVHAAWDVTELRSGKTRELLDEDPNLLKIGVKGI
ncbi:NAD(P)-binding protein [Aspergillus karnatakaensis]|uniref:SDR family NAD(P)-dependent oxidoreductase n=1 Tax=Aspergillus karnatakaensis TaxID=1810916 RepID=UPI003CCCE4E2